MPHGVRQRGDRFALPRTSVFPGFVPISFRCWHLRANITSESPTIKARGLTDRIPPRRESGQGRARTRGSFDSAGTSLREVPAALRMATRKEFIAGGKSGTRRCRASPDWTDEGICPYVILHWFILNQCRG